MTSKAIKVVICDAGPIIHLDEIHCIDLLTDFSEVIVPDAVWQEVLHHRPKALTENLILFQRAATTENTSSELQALCKSLTLHKGEIEALKIAQQRQSDLFLTDDTAARLAAKHLEIPVHGSIGVLLRAIRRHQRSADEIINLLERLPSLSSLHIKPVLITTIIQQIREENSIR